MGCLSCSIAKTMRGHLSLTVPECLCDGLCRRHPHFGASPQRQEFPARAFPAGCVAPAHQPGSSVLGRHFIGAYHILYFFHFTYRYYVGLKDNSRTGTLKGAALAAESSMTLVLPRWSPSVHKQVLEQQACVAASNVTADCVSP